MKKLQIVPFGKISREILEKINEELRYSLKIFCDILEERELPKEFYNAFRDQYIAEQILDFLMKKFKVNTLAVTDKDLYAEGLNFIFGQAQLNGRVAIVSIYRLNPTFYGKSEDKDLLIERAVKEAIHEVGHMLGLYHCKNSKCVMNFSNTIFDVDRKSKELCKECRKNIVQSYKI